MPLEELSAKKRWCFSKLSGKTYSTRTVNLSWAAAAAQGIKEEPRGQPCLAVILPIDCSTRRWYIKNVI